MSSIETLLAHWFYAIIFVVASHHKIVHWQRFKASVFAYKIIPGFLVTFSAGLLTLAELIVIGALIFLQPIGLFLSGALLTIYLIAITINMARGRHFIDCGCGDQPSPLSPALVLRNILLTSGAFGAYFFGAWPVNIEITGSLVALSIAIAAAGVYLTIDQLLANQGKYRRLWLGEY